MFFHGIVLVLKVILIGLLVKVVLFLYIYLNKNHTILYNIYNFVIDRKIFRSTVVCASLLDNNINNDIIYYIE